MWIAVQIKRSILISGQKYIRDIGRKNDVPEKETKESVEASPLAMYSGPITTSIYSIVLQTKLFDTTQKSSRSIRSENMAESVILLSST
jgi:hypothetical protein